MLSHSVLPQGQPPFMAVDPGSPVNPALGEQAETGQPRALEAHATIIFEGQRNRHLYKVVDGCIALYQLLGDGRRQIIDIVGPGRLFGYPLSQLAACTAEALTYTRLSLIGEAKNAQSINEELLLSLGRARDHATLLGRKSAAERVATAMFDLSRQFARRSRSTRSDRVTFMLYLTRYELADWLGLTFETVSRCLNQLKRDGIISYDQPELVTVLDMSRLRSQAGITSKTNIQ